jgi:hypothetical protein
LTLQTRGPVNFDESSRELLIESGLKCGDTITIHPSPSALGLGVAQRMAVTLSALEASVPETSSNFPHSTSKVSDPQVRRKKYPKLA